MTGPDPELATPGQHAEMRALWTEFGLAGAGERDRRLKLTAVWAGVDFIESSTDLGHRHAVAVLRRLADCVASGVPAWLAEKYPAACRWRPAGGCRWHAQVPGWGGQPGDLLVLTDADSTRAVSFTLDLSEFGSRADEVADHTFVELQARLDRETLPACTAPRCGQKGSVAFVAAEAGRLAGTLYSVGDEIRMCPKHGIDVRAAGEGLENIAAWLRPDAAVLDPGVIAQYRRLGADDDYIRRTRARLPRVGIRPDGIAR